MADVVVDKLTQSDRPTWDSLFQGYLDFYETSIDRSAFDRAWDAFQRDDVMHALGARIEDRLVGIAHLLTHASTTAADVCYLQDLYTVPEARGQGVAHALVDAVAQYARQQRCSRVYWVTHESNATARALYDKIAVNSGFVRYQIAL